MTRVHVPDIAETGKQIVVRGDEAHHLLRVVRMRPGDPVRVFDGRGREWQATVAATGRDGLTLDLAGPVPPVPEPGIAITLGVGLLKGDQMDAVVRDATVMGVATIVPLATDHVVSPARAWRGDGAAARWRRVAIAAAAQCGRAVVPAIAPATTLTDLRDTCPADLTLACLEPAATDAPFADGWRSLPRPSSVLLLVGPEGGWSRAEVDALAAAGVHRVSLGPRTLRAQAAPAVALTLVWATWGWEA